LIINPIFAVDLGGGGTSR